MELYIDEVRSNKYSEAFIMDLDTLVMSHMSVDKLHKLLFEYKKNRFSDVELIGVDFEEINSDMDSVYEACDTIKIRICIEKLENTISMTTYGMLRGVYKNDEQLGYVNVDVFGNIDSANTDMNKTCFTITSRNTFGNTLIDLATACGKGKTWEEYIVNKEDTHIGYLNYITCFLNAYKFRQVTVPDGVGYLYLDGNSGEVEIEKLSIGEAPYTKAPKISCGAQSIIKCKSLVVRDGVTSIQQVGLLKFSAYNFVFPKTLHVIKFDSLIDLDGEYGILDTGDGVTRVIGSGNLGTARVRTLRLGKNCTFIGEAAFWILNEADRIEINSNICIITMAFNLSKESRTVIALKRSCRILVYDKNLSKKLKDGTCKVEYID